MSRREKLREALAGVQHDIWAHWMRYLFSCCEYVPKSDVLQLIPRDKVERWQRQMNLSYAHLSDIERDSDRGQADKVLAVLKDHADDLDSLWPICGVCGEKASSIEALVGGGYQVSCSNCDNEAQGDTAEDAADSFGESGPGCPDCAGTGIGRYGDPDTSRCPTCKGGGILR